MGKQKKLGLGNTLKASIAKKRMTPTERHTTAAATKDYAVLGLNSLTQESNLDDFLRTADLAGTDFTAEKLNVKVVTPMWTEALPGEQEIEARRSALLQFKCDIKIPRRPPWTKEMTKEELNRNEKDQFLIWRKNLASVQENQHIILTPFEKNLEVWRQLWRVVERSDVIMQIVDARNPLLFRTEDLETYVKDVDPKKENKLLVNKADFLQDFQREAWAKYFKEQGICAVFYSAVDALSDIQAENDMGHDIESSSSSDSEAELDEEERVILKKFNKFSALLEEDESDSEELVPSPTEALPAAVDEVVKVKEEKQGKVEQNREEVKTDDSMGEDEPAREKGDWVVEGTKKVPEPVPVDYDEMAVIEYKLATGGVLNNSELLSYLLSLRGDNDEYTVGLVGYPNVGKSSTVNTLLQEKRVQTSATPGKTKHFQTFKLGDIVLCDCPGLVFPNTATSRSEMVCNGVLPIDQLRDHVGPISSVIANVPKVVLEALYGIAIPKPDVLEGDRLPFPFEVLREYGLIRGFMTTRGTPDESRSARKILKDYVNGKLLFCHPPPTWDTEEHSFNPITEEQVARGIACASRAKKTAVTTRREACEQGFFEQKAAKIQLKGRGSHSFVGASSGSASVVACAAKSVESGASTGIRQKNAGTGGMVRVTSVSEDNLMQQQQQGGGKPWKKHYKGGTKDKTRRKCHDLDY